MQPEAEKSAERFAAVFTTAYVEPASPEALATDPAVIYDLALVRRLSRLIRDEISAYYWIDVTANEVARSEGCEARLVAMTCHGSGYVRESAVAALGRTARSPISALFVLIRLVDWVAQVRLAATDALERILVHASPSTLLLLLGESLGLKGSSRTDQVAAFQRKCLCVLDSAEVVRIAETLESLSVRNRRTSLQLLCEHSTRREYWLSKAMASPEPLVRIHAFRLIARTRKLTTDEVSLGLHDRSGAVRSVVLAASAISAPPPDEELFSLLFDRSSAVRRVARSLVPEVKRANWAERMLVELLDHSADARVACAMEAIAELGGPAYAEEFAPHHYYTCSKKVRVAAMRGYALLSPKTTLEPFLAALYDECPLLAGTASWALVFRRDALTAAHVLRAIPPDAHLPTRAALRVCSHLEAWEGLFCLLSMMSMAGAAVSAPPC